MRIFIPMFLAITLWSLYPLAASEALKTMNSWHFVLVTLGISFLGSLILAMFYLKSKNLVSTAFHLQKTITKRRLYIIGLNAVSGVFCHTFFFWALALSNKAGVSLIYESWPVIALIATPFLMQKKWQGVSLKEFIISLFCMFGLGVIVLSDTSINLFSFSNDLNVSFDYKTLGGYIFAFIGAYMCAINVSTQATISEYFQGLKDDFAATLVMQILGRSTSFILALLMMFIFSSSEDTFSIDWIPSIYVGLGVMVLGTSLYAYSVLKATSPTIHILYYFVPLLAIIWLWLAGETTLNTGLIIGGAIILGSNIYLSYASRAKAALEG